MSWLARRTTGPCTGFRSRRVAAQDDKFIAQYNARPNRESYKLVSRNCADFVREAVNFYYPKAAKRSPDCRPRCFHAQTRRQIVGSIQQAESRSCNSRLS